ncbi:hypothetical protein NBRC116493_18850 [Aurantivibrio infirmus]
MTSIKNQSKNKKELNSADLSFKQFKLGASIFFLGFVLLYCANVLIVPSLKQELMALLSISLIGLGFLLAVVAEVRFLLYRGIQFFTEKK